LEYFSCLSKYYQVLSDFDVWTDGCDEGSVGWLCNMLHRR
jgi:hypothetical protein